MRSTDVPQILLIEADAAITEFILAELSFQGYSVVAVSEGQTGLQMAKDRDWDLVILDLGLPDREGLALCQSLRQLRDMPILVLSARSQPEQKVARLKAGAADYLAKPFELDELLTRIRVQLRGSPRCAKTCLTFADLSLNILTHEVFRGSETLALSDQEFELLAYFLRHPGEFLTRDRLLSALWKSETPPIGNNLEVSILNLRKKIEPSNAPRLIHTVRGLGYILQEPPANKKETPG